MPDVQASLTIPQVWAILKGDRTVSGHDFLKVCHSKPRTVGELATGTKFIAFPDDGDDSGHGGFRGGKELLVKVEPYWPGEPFHDSYLITYREYDRPNILGSLPLNYPVLVITGPPD